MLFSLARPFLHALDAETAHDLALSALKLGLWPADRGPECERLAVNAMGLNFPNPLGMAAGFDKNAEVPDALLKLGFGFAETGTVTPRAQEGNPTPRVFRLEEDEAIINRLGFNNHGHAQALARLSARKRRQSGIVGVNVGANKDTPNREDDYAAGVAAFYEVADYLTVNISSPNTPGLRDLQAVDALASLLARVDAVRKHKIAETGRHVPILVKIAPDLADDDLDVIARGCVMGMADGLIVSNTTLSRPPSLRSPRARESGGLSGKPLFALSTRALARVHRATDGKLPLIGVGGISSAETAYEKLRAGASLVQLYTGLVYQGPSLVGDIKRGLLRRLDREGVANITDLVGSGAEEWAGRAV